MWVASQRLTLFFPFEQRKLVDPAVCKHVGIGEFEALAEFVAKRRERLRHNGRLVGHDQHQVTIRGADSSRQCLDFGPAEELRDRRPNPLVVELDCRQALGSGLLGQLRDPIDFAASVTAAAGDNDRLDLTARCQHAREGLELRRGERCRDVLEFESEPQVRSIVAEPVHRFLVCEPRKRHLRDRLVAPRCGQFDIELLDQRHNVYFLDEGHFDVELGKLRLAIGSLSLVAETAGDLVITVETGHHQELLELLRRLGKCVERAGEPTAGHKEVASSLRRALDQEGSLDIDKPTLVQDSAGSSSRSRT